MKIHIKRKTILLFSHLKKKKKIPKGKLYLLLSQINRESFVATDSHLYYYCCFHQSLWSPCSHRNTELSMLLEVIQCYLLPKMQLQPP